MPFDEQAFRAWYETRAKRLGLDTNPDAPEHFYDYRAAYMAGAEPDATGHWPSAFKREGHPRMVIDGVNTKTGQRVNMAQPIQAGRTLSESEFTAIKDRVLASLPDDLSEADFQRAIGPRMEAALAEAEHTSPTPEGSATGRFVSNLGSMLNPVTMAEGVYNTVRHPVDTAKAQWQAIEDQYQKAKTAANEGRFSEALGHAGGMVPLIGPAAASAGEQIGSGDIAGGLGSSLGLLAPALIPAAKAGVGAVASRLPSRLTEPIAAAAERISTEQLARTITPTVGPNKVRLANQAAKAAPELARAEGMGAFSRTALADKVATKLEEATAALDAAADERLGARTFPTTPIVKELEAKRARWVAEPVEGSRITPEVTEQGKSGRPIGQTVEPGPNAPRIAALDQMIAEVKALGPVARYEPLRRIREAWDQVARVKYNPSLTQDFLKETGKASGAMEGTGVLRDKLAQFDPETAKANGPYSFYRKVNDVLQAAEETDRARPTVGRKIMARFGGAVAGEAAGGLPGMVAGLVLGPVVDSAVATSPTLRIQYARGLASLADAIRAGDVSQTQSLVSRLKGLQRSVLATRAVGATMLGTPATSLADSQGDQPGAVAQR